MVNQILYFFPGNNTFNFDDLCRVMIKLKEGPGFGEQEITDAFKVSIIWRKSYPIWVYIFHIKQLALE